MLLRAAILAVLFALWLGTVYAATSGSSVHLKPGESVSVDCQVPPTSPTPTTPTITAPPSTTPPQPSATPADRVAQLRSLINSWRTQHGVAPLANDATLSSKDQAGAVNSLDHCAYLLPTGISGVTWATYGYTDVVKMFDAWKVDAQLGQRLLNPQYHRLGIGVAESTSCNLRILWVISLGF